MINKKKVLVISSNSSIESGANKSLVGYVSYINNNYQNILIDVLLPSKGNIEQLLIENSINYKIIPYSNSLWKKNIVGKGDIAFIKLLKRINNFISNFRIKSVIKKYDIIHINALTTDLGASYAYKDNKKVVWHMREFMEEDLGLEFYNKSYAYNMLSKSSKIIAISNCLKDKYAKILEKDIDVIYNGVDFTRFYFKRKYGILQKNYINIFMPGRIVPEKGQFDLIKAVKMLVDDGNFNITLTIIGNGDNKYIEKIKEYVSKNNLPVNIKQFTNDIEEYYKNADIVCVCSNKEAFGRVTVEAMMSGAIVIASDSGANVELVSHKKTGILYKNKCIEDLYNKINYVLENKKVANEIANKGQRYAVDKFTIEKNATNIYNLYNEIIE